MQDDHLSGKSESVKKFDRCQGNYRELSKSQGFIVCPMQCIALDRI